MAFIESFQAAGIYCLQKKAMRERVGLFPLLAWGMIPCKWLKFECRENRILKWEMIVANIIFGKIGFEFWFKIWRDTWFWIMQLCLLILTGREQNTKENVSQQREMLFHGFEGNIRMFFWKRLFSLNLQSNTKGSILEKNMFLR